MAWLVSLFGGGGAAAGAAGGAAATGAATAAPAAATAGTAGAATGAAATAAPTGFGALMAQMQKGQSGAMSGMQKALGMDDLQFKSFLDQNMEAQQKRRDQQMKQAQSPPQFYDFGF